MVSQVSGFGGRGARGVGADDGGAVDPQRPEAEDSTAYLSQVHSQPGTGGRTMVLENAIGGSVVRLSVPSQGRKVGGKRGRVGGFSPASRRRLLRWMHELDESRVPVGSVGMLTLTWPAVYPGPVEAKVLLQRLEKRMLRAWSGVALVWKLEPQERGAPHFHLLVFWGRTLSAEEWQVRLLWCAQAWFEVAGGGDEHHLRFHLGHYGNRPCLEAVESWDRVLRYAGKYVGKPVAVPEEVDRAGGDVESWAWRWPGRWWGCVRADRLPRKVVTVQVPFVVGSLVKRACRRYLEHQKVGRWRLPLGDGRFERKRLNRREAAAAGGLAGAYQYRRKVRRSRLDGCRGMTCFLADKEVRRVVAWAWREVLGRVPAGGERKWSGSASHPGGTRRVAAPGGGGDSGVGLSRGRGAAPGDGNGGVRSSVVGVVPVGECAWRDAASVGGSLASCDVGEGGCSGDRLDRDGNGR